MCINNTVLICYAEKLIQTNLEKVMEKNSKFGQYLYNDDTEWTNTSWMKNSGESSIFYLTFATD